MEVPAGPGVLCVEVPAGLGVPCVEVPADPGVLCVVAPVDLGVLCVVAPVDLGVPAGLGVRCEEDVDLYADLGVLKVVESYAVVPGVQGEYQGVLVFHVGGPPYEGESFDNVRGKILSDRNPLEAYKQQLKQQTTNITYEPLSLISSHHTIVTGWTPVTEILFRFPPIMWGSMWPHTSSLHIGGHGGSSIVPHLCPPPRITPPEVWGRWWPIRSPVDIWIEIMMAAKIRVFFKRRMPLSRIIRPLPGKGGMVMGWREVTRRRSTLWPLSTMWTHSQSGIPFPFLRLILSGGWWLVWARKLLLGEIFLLQLTHTRRRGQYGGSRRSGSG